MKYLIGTIVGVVLVLFIGTKFQWHASPGPSENSLSDEGMSPHQTTPEEARLRSAVIESSKENLAQEKAMEEGRTALDKIQRELAHLKSDRAAVPPQSEEKPNPKGNEKTFEEKEMEQYTLKRLDELKKTLGLTPTQEEAARKLMEERNTQMTQFIAMMPNCCNLGDPCSDFEEKQCQQKKQKAQEEARVRFPLEVGLSNNGEESRRLGYFLSSSQLQTLKDQVNAFAKPQANQFADWYMQMLNDGVLVKLDVDSDQRKGIRKMISDHLLPRIEERTDLLSPQPVGPNWDVRKDAVQLIQSEDFKKLLTDQQKEQLGHLLQNSSQDSNKK